MNIFIETYHLVRKVLLSPKTALDNYKANKLKQEIEKEQAERKRKLVQETIGSISNVEQEINQLETAPVKEDKNLFTFDYVVKDSSGKTIKSSFDAKTISEVEAFLTNEGYEIVKIEPRKKSILNADITIFGTRIRTGDLSFMLTQLSTYLKAGIPLVDSVRILSKQEEKPAKRKIYDRIVYDLVAGEKFSTALENQNDTFPRLLINMVKASEMTGDLPTILDEMSDY